MIKHGLNRERDREIRSYKYLEEVCQIRFTDFKDEVEKIRNNITVDDLHTLFEDYIKYRFQRVMETMNISNYKSDLVVGVNNSERVVKVDVYGYGQDVIHDKNTYEVSIKGDFIFDQSLLTGDIKDAFKDVLGLRSSGNGYRGVSIDIQDKSVVGYKKKKVKLDVRLKIELGASNGKFYFWYINLGGEPIDCSVLKDLKDDERPLSAGYCKDGYLTIEP